MAKYLTGCDLGEEGFKIVHSLKRQSITVGKGMVVPTTFSCAVRSVCFPVCCEPDNRKGRLALLRPTLSFLYSQSWPFTDVMASFSFRQAPPASVSVLPGNTLMDESSGVFPT